MLAQPQTMHENVQLDQLVEAAEMTRDPNEIAYLEELSPLVQQRMPIDVAP